MPLTLTIRNADVLENGSPLSLILDRRGAIIGRAPTSDWCLPDPNLYISSRHCEIQFRDGTYVLNDISTNGTFLRGSDTRLPGPHAIGSGDCFVVGQFEITAALDDATASAMAQRNAAPQQPQWQGWDAHRGSSDAAAAATPGQWDAARPAQRSRAPAQCPKAGHRRPPKRHRPAAAGVHRPRSPQPRRHLRLRPAGAHLPSLRPVRRRLTPGSGCRSTGWRRSGRRLGRGACCTHRIEHGRSVALVDAFCAAADARLRLVSAGLRDTGAAERGRHWGSFAESNVVDWARGGFGSAPSRPVSVPMHTPATGANLQPLPEPPRGPAPAPRSAPAPARPSQAAMAPGPAGSAGLAELLATAGVAPANLKRSEAETLQQAGQLMRSLVAGLVVLLEARARAKNQLGAQGTSLEFDGNNPLKFARTPEQALAQLLNPAERGFMTAERAIEDLSRDLQAHQMATLKAMQGALKATLDRFSPQAIRARAQQGGLLSKILPNAKDAALWAAYEREFSGVAQGSDEAFMDVFAKEFRRAYEELAGKA